ncbi:hypothetical protein BGX27_008819 [Mortierella sp. AM989]|nr:hypothetical protein BGX27_008819 [Mortierella sp. AM989]
MGAQWKREKVQDHKFDFINVDDFVDNSCWRQFRYTLVFVAIIRGILVYCSDIFTAVNLLANDNSGTFFKKDTLSVEGLHIELPFKVYKYLFTGCIIFGFLLLALEIRRAKNIIKSRDISYAFTSQIASRFYTVRSYPHYCFFSQINNSKKMVDDVAFFCFFTFRNWKRLILADAPRQVINATILYQTFREFNFQNDFIGEWNKIFRGDTYKMISIGAMIFTVTIFAISMLSLIIAVFLYIPLVTHIQGNLKEYCCHKIDKRIDELILKNTKNRANAQAKGGKNNNDIAMNNFQQPTLPQIDLLEAPPMPAKTPRTAYAVPPYSASNGGGYGQQQDYGYDQQVYSPQQSGYAPNYSQDEYFQAKPIKNQQREKDFDPYAESAFTTDDVYDGYVGTQDKQHLQQASSDNEFYNDFYSNSQPAPTPSSQTRRHDDYSYQRSASPLPSQHGSDLESNHNSSNGGHNYSGGNNAYGVNNNRYGGNNGNSGGNGGYGGYQGYGNDYYSSGAPNSAMSPPISPQRSRRQDTAPSRERSNRNNGGY